MALHLSVVCDHCQPMEHPHVGGVVTHTPSTQLPDALIRQ
jgi:hypothetical protein